MAQIDKVPGCEVNPFGRFAFGLPRCQSGELTELVTVMADYHGR